MINFLKSIVVGIGGIAPGLSGSVLLVIFGLYELYVSSVANINIPVLLPAAAGLGLGALTISFFVNKLLKKYYTITFSMIFGLFISIIPSVLNGSCYLGINIQSFVSIILLIIGFLGSYFLGKFKT